MSDSPPETQKSTDHMVDYDQNSAAQQSIVSVHEAALRRLASGTLDTGRRLRITDYGCGPGTSAITSVKPVLETWRAEGPETPLAVCHMDQPDNDWNALFQLATGPDGYRATVTDVRTEAVVGSFYDRVMEDATVDIATCFAASHWLSRAARLYCPGSVWFADLEGPARTELETLAQDDWETFLRLRAAELRSGGYLFVSTLASVPDPAEKNGAAASGRGIYRALQYVAQSMADDGLLDSDVLDHFLFSLWFLTAQEARKPIDNGHLASLYQIDTVDVRPSPKNPTDFFADLITDADAYADAYTGYIRAFADTTLRPQLFAPSATASRSEDALATEFYTRLTDTYRARKAEFAFELWHLTVILRRT
ncbi:MAG: hypothetical protein AAGF74_03130 [Pseudomonadota bacterium]